MNMIVLTMDFSWIFSTAYNQRCIGLGPLIPLTRAGSCAGDGIDIWEFPV